MTRPPAAAAPVLRAGVLGRPIAHSLSPALHAAAYAALGLAVHYDHHDLGVAELPAFAAGRLAAGPLDAAAGPDAGLDVGPMDPAAGLAARAGGEDWLGVSVTMPLKAAAAQLADEVSERVALLGVANTLVRDHPEHPGLLWAHNTDVDGVLGALRSATAAADPTASDSTASDPPGGTVGVLGNGGTAAAAVLAAQLMGADGVALGVRDPARAAATAELAASLGLGVDLTDQAGLIARAPQLRAVVATLPPRAADPLAAAVPDPRAGEQALPPLLDAAYDPWPSALARAWSARGGAVVSGVTMLLHQGIAQVRLFTERPRRAVGAAEPDWDAVTAAAARALGLAPA